MNIPQFKYYQQPEVNAILTQQKCQSCDSEEYCLEGEYFDHGSSVESVCLSCLSKGKITVNIPDFVRNRIKNHLTGDCTKSQDSTQERVNQLIDELSKNPPVPWIQYNAWPVCCDDFCRYLGEWDQSTIVEKAQDKSTKDYLMSILDDFNKERIDDFDSLWNDIGNGTAIFVFECIKCSKIIAVCQSY